MRLTAIWSMTILAFATGAWAQDNWSPMNCADLDAGSFEAEMLDCGPDTTRAAPEPSAQPENAVTERPPEAAPAREATSEPEQSRESRATGDGRTADVEEIAPDPGLVDVEPDPGEGRGNDQDAGLRIPRGHRPPPGQCRVWFPDRPPGHQPPPSACDVDVPKGAVLIRG